MIEKYSANMCYVHVQSHVSVEDWRSQKLFGLSIKMWQLTADKKGGKEFSLVIPETAYIQTFLRSLMNSLRSDLDLPEDTIAAISGGVLAQLLVKEEEISVDLDDEMLKEKDERNEKSDEDDKDDVREIEDADGGSGSSYESEESQSDSDSENEVEKMEVVKESEDKENKKTRDPKKDSNDNKEGGVFPCSQDKCGRIFRTSLGVLRHFKRAHASLFCPCCKVCHPNAAAREDHLCLKPFPCPDCGRRFGYQHELRDHALIHAGKLPHVCDVCDKAFRQKTTLRRHQLQHSGVARHVCQVNDDEDAYKKFPGLLWLY
jgi:hypothetical protein